MNKESINDVHKSHFFLIDESDFTTDQPITFDSDGDLNGLYHLLQAEKVFFIGSTLSDTQKQVMQKTFKVDADDILEPNPTAPQLLNEHAKYHDIKYNIAKSEEEQIENLCDDIPNNPTTS